VALQLLTLLLERPTDDSVEVAVDFVKECGSILTEVAIRRHAVDAVLSTNVCAVSCHRPACTAFLSG
jgi:hypothetical protein